MGNNVSAIAMIGYSTVDSNPLSPCDTNMNNPAHVGVEPTVARMGEYSNTNNDVAPVARNVYGGALHSLRSPVEDRVK